MHEKFVKALSELDGITLNFSEQGLFFINITLAFIMFGVALDIKVDSFRKVVMAPKSAIIGVFSQFFLLPALTFLMVWLLKLTPAVGLGMILVAACPGGNISNFISALAQANTALSVSLTAIATLASVFMTPLNFAFWAGLYFQTLPLVNPIEIPLSQVFQTVFILLGIPLILGLSFAYKFPRLTKKILKPIKIASIFAFFGFVIGALAANFDNFMRFIYLIIPIVFVHNALALTTGFSIARIFRLPQRDRRTISIETGIQNSGLALVLIFSHKIFPEGMGGIAFIAAWWGVWHIISGLIMGFLWAKIPVRDEN